MIRVALPVHLRTLARVESEVRLEVAEPVTPGRILDALEAAYPVLRGTIRHQASQQRRPLVRFFCCGEDFSHEPPNALLPDAITNGTEPFFIVGAMAGG